MLFWGCAVMLFIYYFYPFLLKIYLKTKGKLVNVICIIFFILLICDIAISACAIFRQNLRHKNIEAKTPIGRFCDKHYSDEYLKKIYDNLIFVDN